MSLFVNSLSNKLFEEHFSKVYQDRWPQILVALAKPEKQILRPNLFIDRRDEVEAQACEFLPGSLWKPEGFKLEKNDQGIYSYYVMDPASMIV